MVGIIIIAHGDLAQALHHAVEHVLGKQRQMEFINVAADSDPVALQHQLDRCIDQCDGGNGVILCADMFGGTPCNVALGRLDPEKIDILSGISLPSLITIASERSQIADPTALARKGAASGRRYLCMASTMLKPGA
ncbi:MAG: PTS system fructose subfamily IIA component [Mariprofundales bacterium]|nr:PTS system fructose subfamily IIA component [Mariprofundales bacterium]